MLEYASLSFLDDFVAFLALFFRSMVLMLNLEQTFSPAHPHSTPPHRCRPSVWPVIERHELLGELYKRGHSG